MPPVDQSRRFENTGSKRDVDRASAKKGRAKQFRNKEASRKQEDLAAEILAGRTQPASGAFQGHKGDVITRFFKLECKTTENRSLSIKAAWLDKLWREAEMDDQIPAMAIEFQRLSPVIGKQWALIPLPVLATLLAAWEEREKDFS